jgi:glutamyl-tRNA synthetase
VVLRTAEMLDLKMGKVAQPLRVAITGTTASPAIDETLALVGRDRTIARIERAQARISAERA